MTDWIEKQFPTDDEEAFNEAFEQTILGGFGPVGGTVETSLDELVEYARLTPVFRGRFLVAYGPKFGDPWTDCAEQGSREQKILTGAISFIWRARIVTMTGDLQDWFKRHAYELEQSETGIMLGALALKTIATLEPELTPEMRSWWLEFASCAVWGDIIYELFPDKEEQPP